MPNQWTLTHLSGASEPKTHLAPGLCSEGLMGSSASAVPEASPTLAMVASSEVIL